MFCRLSTHILFPYTTLFRSNGDEEPIEWTDELGSMFFDFKYPEKGMMAIPYFFNAHIKNGILEVPEYLYKEVLRDRKSTRLNSSHVAISYAVFCLKKKLIYN